MNSDVGPHAPPRPPSVPGADGHAEAGQVRGSGVSGCAHGSPARRSRTDLTGLARACGARSPATVAAVHVEAAVTAESAFAAVSPGPAAALAVPAPARYVRPPGGCVPFVVSGDVSAARSTRPAPPAADPAGVIGELRAPALIPRLALFALTVRTARAVRPCVAEGGEPAMPFLVGPAVEEWPAIRRVRGPAAAAASIFAPAARSVSRGPFPAPRPSVGTVSTCHGVLRSRPIRSRARRRDGRPGAEPQRAPNPDGARNMLRTDRDAARSVSPSP